MNSLEDTLYSMRWLYEVAPQPARTLAGMAFRSLPASWRYGPAYARFHAEALASENWDEEAKVHYQTAEAHASLLSVVKAPFYRQRFAEHGLDPARFESLEQLKDYPLLEKCDLLTHCEAMVNPDLPARSRLYLTTGGSSGIPVGFYLHKGVSRPKEQAYLEAQWRRRGYQPGAPTAILRGSTAGALARDSISWYDASRNWLVFSSIDLTEKRLPDYLAALNRFKPRHLHAYPSSALLLARLMIEAGVRLEFELTSLFCGSEKLCTEDQAFLERHFQAPVFHWYGHSERVVLAGQGANSDHLYFWPGYGLAELGPPDVEGRREIIGTTFHNHVMPLIRYRTGDYVQVPSEPHGELPMLEIASVAGRGYEFLVSASGRRVALTIVNRHDDVFDGLLAVQFVQRTPGVVEFRYQTGSRWLPQNLDRIKTTLLNQLGDDFDVSFKQVDFVEKTAGGKHRWLITSLAAGGLT